MYLDFGNKGCAEDDFPVDLSSLITQFSIAFCAEVSELITKYDQKYWDGIAKEISDIYLNGDM